MWNGKAKAVTFSYDDGVTADRRLVKIFNKYGVKATFNLNSGVFQRRDDSGELINWGKICESEVLPLYAGHEVAAHTVTHPSLAMLLTDDEIIAQAERDRVKLSQLCGYEVVGMAYPNGSYDERVMRLLEDNTNIKYSRTVKSTLNFELPKNYYSLHPTCHHKDQRLFELAEEFLAYNGKEPKLFYVWGHSYEFDNDNNWEIIEEFCAKISGRDDVFYGTNAEVLGLKGL